MPVEIIETRDDCDAIREQLAARVAELEEAIRRAPHEAWCGSVLGGDIDPIEPPCSCWKSSVRGGAQ